MQEAMPPSHARASLTNVSSSKRKRRRGGLARSSSVAALASRLHRLVCPPKVGQRYCATPGFTAANAVSGNHRGLRSSLLSRLSRLSACRPTIIHSWHSRAYSRVSEPHHYHTGPPCSGGVGEQSLSRLSFPLFSLSLFPLSLSPAHSLSLSLSLSTRCRHRIPLIRASRPQWRLERGGGTTARRYADRTHELCNLVTY